MGAYLRVGICATIKVDNTAINAEAAEEYLSQSIDLALYDFQEEEDSLVWTLQEQYLQEGLIDFLQEQFGLAFDMIDEDDVAHLLEALEEQHTFEEFQSVSRDWDRAFYNFQHNERYEPDTVVCGKTRHYTRFRYGMIEFFIEGKAMMECNRILRYFERLIRMQQDKHPLAGATRIYIE